jgi:hypothetical protein
MLVIMMLGLWSGPCVVRGVDALQHQELNPAGGGALMPAEKISALPLEEPCVA